jgi:hypothetical protein
MSETLGSSDGTPEQWAIFEKSVETATKLLGEGKSIEEIAHELHKSTNLSPAGAKYIARGVSWTPDQGI